MAGYCSGAFAAAAAAIVLAGCAAPGLPGSGPATGAANAPTAYGIPGDAGSHGSVYSALFGRNEGGARQAEPAAQAATPPGAAPPTTTVASASTPANAPTAYGIPSDAGSHGSVYSHFFGPNAAQELASPPATPTAYGIPSDAGSHGSLYSYVFGSKNAEAANPPDPSAATPSNSSSTPAPPPR